MAGHRVKLQASQLRVLFNEARIWDRRLANELLEVSMREAPPTPANKQPSGTVSVLARIIDLRSGQTVAIIHYYRLPDGSINNAAGLPDPKLCVVEGVTYVLG